MNINLLPFTVAWMVMSAIVVALIIYRKLIAKNEDSRLHVSPSESGLVSQQTAVAHTLESIDRWGQALTVVVLLFGLAIAAGYCYQAWLSS